MKRPGHWLQAAARRVCAKQTMERLIDPIVADLQTEHEEAARTRRRWRAARICASGYAAFWKAVCLHTIESGPRALWNDIAADGSSLGRIVVYSLIVFLSLTLLLTAPSIINFYSRVQHLKLTLLLVPEAVPLSIPIALSMGIAWSGYGVRAGTRKIRGVLALAVLATLLAFGGMVMRPVATQAFDAVMAEALRSQGRTYSVTRGPNDLSLSELAMGSAHYHDAGFPEKALHFRRTYHIRFAIPAATFVLSLLALGLCGTVRWRAVRVLALVAAVAAYWVLLAISELKPSTVLLSPIVWIWAPNVLFTAVSLVLLKISSSPPRPVPSRQPNTQHSLL
jgi:hypothetical protein